MTRRTRSRRTGRERVAGQMIVIFTLCLIAIISMAALLVDGGLAGSNRRQAQAAADTAALAAAHDVVANDTAKGEDVARTVAQANGFAKDLIDCSGNTVANAGVVVNRPPLQGAHNIANDPTGANDYVEVVTTRAMHTTFAAAVGQGCWMVTSRAVASIGSSAVVQCSFCSLNNTKNNHTILLQNGARLRVDGDIYTNSFNGCVSSSTVPGSSPPLTQCNDNATCAMKDWKACGDGFDVFGTPESPPAYISAKTISVVGGWETHDQNIVFADTRLAPPTRTACPNSPTPPEQLIADPTPSNVCIHMPPIVDPYAGTPAPAAADYAVPTLATCTALPGTLGVKVPTDATHTLTVSTAGSWTICPGKYFGLIVTGVTTKVVMRTGVYYLSSTGLTVNGGGSIDGSSGVMIYNAGTGLVSIVQLPDSTVTPADPDMAVDHIPPHSYSVNTNSKIVSSGNPVDVTKGAKKVTYTFTVNKSSVKGAPNLSAGAIVDFFDGEGSALGGTPICTATLAAATNKWVPTCAATYNSGDVGIHGIAAVFYNDPVYNDWESMLPGPPGAAQPGEVVKVTGITGGTTSLRAMTSGPFAGFVIWQDKTRAQNIVLSPQSALADCDVMHGANWMTDGIPTTAPSPCGDIGGISGTIYAGQQDSQVQITTSGLADLQVIAGRILINAGVETRFAFTPGKFALGGIRLIE